MRSYALVLALLTLLSGPGARAQDRVVTLLYTNDIESVYEPVEAFWNPDVERIGGLPHLATLIDRVRRESGERTFLFDAGDIYTGALSQASGGRLAFDLYGLMGYDAVNLGNHEFEYGWEALRRVRQRARFPVLCANLFYEGTDVPFSQAYTIVERGGVRVGVVGAIGVDAFYSAVHPAHRRGLEVRPVAPAVQEYVDLVRDEVDLVVVLTHQNRTAPMQTDKEADPEVQRGFDEDYALAGALRGVDVVLGGHSDHGLWEPVRHPDTGTWIGLTFGQGKYLGQMRLSVGAGGVDMLGGRLIPVESDEFEPHAGVVARIEAERARAPHLTEEVGRIGGLASRRYYRESALGDLLADMLRGASGADVAVVNSGSIRADLNAGAVTVEDVLNVYPFVGPYHVVEVDSAGVRALLEHSYGLAYGLAQVSGLEATYDSRRPAGARVVSVRVGGEPLAGGRRYTVAADAFLAGGGDGYSVLEGGALVRRGSGWMSQAFLDAFRSAGEVRVPTLGRQRDLAQE